jgi:hypothetical protein|nr:MAG TPA: hypothetical protein [Caudoviricetes sp.]
MNPFYDAIRKINSPEFQEALKTARLAQRAIGQIDPRALSTAYNLYRNQKHNLSLIQEIHKAGGFNNLSQVFVELNQYRQIREQISKNFDIDDFDKLSLAINDATHSPTFATIIEKPETVEVEDIITDSNFEKLLRLAEHNGIERKDLVNWLITILAIMVQLICGLLNDSTSTNITINNQITICPSSKIPLQQEPDATFEEGQSNPALKSEDV